MHSSATTVITVAPSVAAMRSRTLGNLLKALKSVVLMAAYGVSVIPGWVASAIRHWRDK